jgi:hypothetical protein
MFILKLDSSNASFFKRATDRDTGKKIAPLAYFSL